MANKHSPTPWKARDMIGRSIAIYGADKKLACEVYVAEGMEEQGIATAKFLTSTVNHRDALLRFVEHFRQTLIEHYGHCDNAKCCNVSRTIARVKNFR